MRAHTDQIGILQRTVIPTIDPHETIDVLSSGDGLFEESVRDRVDRDVRADTKRE